MIKELNDYRVFLLDRFKYYGEIGEKDKEKQCYEKAQTCELLIDLYDEMKLSTNEWHIIKVLVNEYRGLRYGRV